ncbi:MAG: single-stranded-DNA-specific exonuclease RecJ [Dehalococcoidia bacterium]|nr:single-stranded-DNA-specific exonuclease RecJ [Dehalococcoidia bacterium]
MKQQWQLLPQAPDEYMSACGVPSVIAQLLYNRGVKPDEAELFLAADQRLEGNPFLFPDMSQAVSRIYKALLSGEKIAIYGDFDVDGVTATAALVEGLSWLGAKVIPHIADRFCEGRGLQLPAIEELCSQGVSLLITVDCGIGNLVETKQAQEMGIDVIITDHHIPSATLPQAIAVIDSKRSDSRYPYPDLAGVGVAFKVLQALFHEDGRKKELAKLLDLVALGTVTDLVPLIGENRYLVREGLKVLNNTHRIGLQEMIKLARLEPGSLDTEHISWTLGPRLNAAGRVGRASNSYQLLATHSTEEAHRLAVELGEMNTERQQLTNEVLSKTKERLVHKASFPLLIEGDESYPIGVIGLVAGKLVDEFHKPSIILSLGPDVCRGSCRSIPEFNIVSALEKCRDLLHGFGGHPLAAGFTLTRENLARLEERLMSLAVSELSHLDLRAELAIDAEVALSAFAGDTFNLIQKLSPFGKGNPQPVFLSRQVEVTECRSFGNQGKHLELKLRQGDITWRAVDFASQKTREEVTSHIDIVYSIEKSSWGGEEVLRLNLRDFAPSQPR